MTILADTGALYALVDASDAWHARVAQWWPVHGHQVVIPAPVLPELAWLLGSRIGAHAEIAFFEALAADEFQVEPLDIDDYERAVALMQRYADLPLGFVDAAIVAMAERMGARQVLTTDRRHFGVVRPQHVRAFALVP